MSAAQAGLVTRETDPGLFEDRLDGRAAARLIGVGSGSTIRRKVLSGAIPSQACVVFGSRGMRRFRPAFLEEERRRRFRGALV